MRKEERRDDLYLDTHNDPTRPILHFVLITGKARPIPHSAIIIIRLMPIRIIIISIGIIEKEIGINVVPLSFFNEIGQWIKDGKIVRSGDPSKRLAPKLKRTHLAIFPCPSNPIMVQ